MIMRIIPTYAAKSPPISTCHLLKAINRPFLSSSNTFTTASPALRAPHPAPSVRRALRRNLPTTTGVIAIPPVAADELKHLKSILLDSPSNLEPSVAALLLQTFRNLLRGGIDGGARDEKTQRVIEESKISANDLALLATIVQRKRNASNAPLVRLLWDAAATQGSSAGALELVQYAAWSGSTGAADVRRAKSLVESTARSSGTLAAAAGLAMGKLAEAEGRIVEAEQWVRGVVIRAESADQTEDAAFGEAWRMLARLRRAQGDEKGEREALEGGSDVADDAEACLELAIRFMDGKKGFRELLGRAAGAGIAKAAQALGKDLLTEVRAGEDDLRSHRGWLPSIFHPTTAITSVRAQAFEWFFVAAASLQAEVAAEAKLHLAMMLRDQGNVIQGAEMLESASTSARLRKHAIPLIREHWNDEQKRLLAINLNPILARG